MDVVGWIIVLGVVVFLIWVIVTSITYLRPPKGEEQYLIVVVQDQEHFIEYIIRKMLIKKRELGDGTRLIIVDVGSKDKTLEIIERLSYPKNYFVVVRTKSFTELKNFLNRLYTKKPIYVKRYLGTTKSQ